MKFLTLARAQCDASRLVADYALIVTDRMVVSVVIGDDKASYVNGSGVSGLVGSAMAICPLLVLLLDGCARHDITG